MLFPDLKLGVKLAAVLVVLSLPSGGVFHFTVPPAGQVSVELVLGNTTLSQTDLHYTDQSGPSQLPGQDRLAAMRYLLRSIFAG